MSSRAEAKGKLFSVTRLVLLFSGCVLNRHISYCNRQNSYKKSCSWFLPVVTQFRLWHSLGCDITVLYRWHERERERKDIEKKFKKCMLLLAPGKCERNLRLSKDRGVFCMFRRQKAFSKLTANLSVTGKRGPSKSTLLGRDVYTASTPTPLSWIARKCEQSPMSSGRSC